MCRIQVVGLWTILPFLSGAVCFLCCFAGAAVDDPVRFPQFGKANVMVWHLMFTVVTLGSVLVEFPFPSLHCFDYLLVIVSCLFISYPGFLCLCLPCTSVFYCLFCPSVMCFGVLFPVLWLVRLCPVPACFLFYFVSYPGFVLKSSVSVLCPVVVIVYPCWVTLPFSFCLVLAPVQPSLCIQRFLPFCS